MTVSTSGMSSTISRPTVPWPAAINGSSYGCTITRPVSAAMARIRSRASMLSADSRSTVAPYPRVAATLSGLASAGMSTRASTPSSRAASASAWAWLPAEIVIVPSSRSSGVRARSRLNAPRGLNAPIRWKSSALSQTGAPQRAASVADVSTGVRCTRPAIASAAAWTSASVGDSAMPQCSHKPRGARPRLVARETPVPDADGSSNPRPLVETETSGPGPGVSSVKRVDLVPAFHP